MRSTQHPSNTSVLGAPVGWEQGVLPCSALPITRCQENGVPIVQSFWRPNPAELAALNAGALVVLSLVGENMPPAAIEVAAE